MRFRRCSAGIIFIMLCLFIEIRSFPTETTAAKESDLVVTSDKPSTSSDIQTNVKPKIKSMNVDCIVSSRYANTTVTSRVINPSGKANEVTFSMVLPDTAFITGFSMEIEGKVYEAYVKEKAEAKKVYDQAVSSGQSAAHVAVQARDSNHFTVSVNLEPQSKAIFRLRYEELLIRRVGLYNVVINLNPGQIIDDLTVTVDIQENSPIKSLLVPELKTGNEIDALPTDPSNPYATKMLSEDGLHATVVFSPNKEQQLELMRLFKQKASELTTPSPYGPSSYVTNPEKEKPEEGLSGQFVVQYDVDRNVNGEVLVNDGYFVHFFAPENLKPLSKHVIFVLDVSGSMIGRKVVQLKDAMTSILQDLNPGDYFNIIDFSYGVKVYNLDDPKNNAYYKPSNNDYYETPKESVISPEVPPKPKLATPENIKQAKEIIQQLVANGGTNIYDALQTALKIANHGISMQNSPENSTLPNKGLRHEPMIIFLTDGEPTVGITNKNKITKDVSETNNKKTAIFSLAFGEDADRNFLRKISLKNYGFMRHIYEAADASLQLRHFYRQISSPLLANVKYSYPPNQIDEKTTTKNRFPHFFMGSEIITAGKLLGTELDDFKISADSYTGSIDFIPIIPKEKKKEEYWPLERLWAYLTIKQLLDESDAADGPEKENSDLSKKALELALKYSFVTPLTSLVVVKPNSSSAVGAESLQNTPPPFLGFQGIPLAAGPLGGNYPSSFSSSGYMASIVPSTASSFRYFSMKRPYIPQPRFGPVSHSIQYSQRGPFLSSPVSLAYAPPAPIGAYGPASSASSGAASGAAYGPALGQSFQSFSAAILGGIPLSLRLASAQFVTRPYLAFEYRTTTNRPHFNMLSDISYEEKEYEFEASRQKVAAPGKSGSKYGTAASGYSLDSFAIEEEEADIATADLSTDPVSDLTTTVTSPVSKLDPYNLQSYPWLEQYLSDKDNSITLPTNNGNVTYKLKLTTDAKGTDTNPPCSNSIDGGSGVCKYLTESNKTNEALVDLTTYLKYSCDSNGYAGICSSP